MKWINLKLLVITILLFLPVVSIAVPPGTYLDNRGRVKAHVDQSGTIISRVESDGSINVRFAVTEEHSDGTFVTHNNLGVDNHDNAWWVENGKVYMRLGSQINLGGRTNVLVREE